MVQQLAKEPSTRLLKHVVRCYLRLSDNLRYTKDIHDIASCECRVWRTIYTQFSVVGIKIVLLTDSTEHCL